MITVDHVVAFAIRDHTVLDQLGEALRSDLVIANAFYRRIVGFADTFLLDHRKLPASGDWDMWLQSLDTGLIQDGTREALSRLLAIDLGAFTPAYFAPQALEQLQQAAVLVARGRLNDAPTVTIDSFVELARQVDSVRASGLQGLARLSDIDTWAQPLREEDLIPTGYPTLDRSIGGWGKELWIMFADSGVGKSMFLQNCLANAAQKGKRCLHVTLELGLRPQIHRYYRQIAQVTRAEFYTANDKMKQSLAHWMKFATGEIFLLEFPAYSLTPDELKRTIERLARTVGNIDILGLDYLDLMTLPAQSSAGRGYEDLGRLTHETRALCPAFDMSVLSASQSIRRPEKADRLTMKDMGDSYQKVRGTDGLIYLVQTPEEEEMYQGRLGILKARDSGGRGQEVPLYINRELAIIQELDHPNTVHLMKRLGHLPAQLSKQPNKGGVIDALQ